MIILSKIDFLGIPATLNFFGKGKKKSNFGGLCTLLFLGFVIWATYNSSQDLLKRQSPDITLSEINVQDPREMNISTSAFPLGWIVQRPIALGNAGFINDSIYTIDVVYTVVERIKQPDGTIKKVVTNTPLAVENCTKAHFGQYASSVADLTFKGSHCLARNQTGLDQLTIQGIYSSNVYRSLTATVTSCINGTGVVCGTPDEINKQLSGSGFSALYMDNTMNIQNYSDPMGKLRQISGTLMNPNSYKEVNMEIGFLEVQTDSGLITSDIKSEYTLKVVEIDELVDLNPSPDKVLLFWYMEANRLETYYTRTYKKIPTILAEVGGLANSFLGILLIIITPYLRLKSREALMNELFDFNGQADLERKQRRAQNNTRRSRRKSNKEDPISSDRQKIFITETMLFKEMSSPTYANEVQENIKPILSPKSPQLRSISEVHIPSEYYSQETPNSPEKPVLIQRASQNEESPPPLLSFSSPRTFSYESQSPLKRLISDSPVKKADGDGSGELEDEIERQLKDVEIKLTEREGREQREGEGEVNEDGSEEEKVVIEIEMGTVEKNNEQENQEKSIEKGSIGGTRSSFFRNNTKSTTPKNSIKKVELAVWEYVMSFTGTWKPKSLRTKLEMIEEGVKNIEERLDVNNMLKKFCEVDKLIALLLDRDQLELFNNMPKPQFQTRRRENPLQKKSTYEQNLVRKMTIIQPRKNEDLMQESYEKIQQRKTKSDIDLKLLSIFKDDFS